MSNTEAMEITTVGSLQKALDELNPTHVLLAQVVGQSGGAWNMHAELTPPPSLAKTVAGTIVLYHPQLKRLPEMAGNPHPDDNSIDMFAEAMKQRMAEKRELGYGGWEEPDPSRPDDLRALLRKAVEAGDPVDVANYAMMLHHFREPTNKETT